MNKFFNAINALDLGEVKEQIAKDPKWLGWKDAKDRNALHFLCAIVVSDDANKADASLEMLKFFLAKGMDVNSVRLIPEPNCTTFPATPLWYAYARGRNEKLYRYLLKRSSDPNNCWWAMSWYDDVESGKLWLKHGATIKGKELDRLFIGTFAWKKYKFTEWLLKLGADVNTFGSNGLNALMIAVRRKDEEAIKLLLSYHADPDLKNADGVSARTIAQSKGPKRIARLLEPA